jgi:hypothetical protein
MANRPSLSSQIIGTANPLSLIRVSIVASALGFFFLLGIYSTDTLSAVSTAAAATPPPPPPKNTPTPTSIYGGAWSDDFLYSKQLSAMDNVQLSESRLTLKFAESLDWEQTWDAHFAMGEFWHTVALLDSVQLALDGPNQYFTTGIYTSTIFDAARPVDWTSARWRHSGIIPSSVTLEFRTGNTTPVDESWSAWSVPSAVSVGDLRCAVGISPSLTDCFSTLPGIESSRYLQYRVTFDSHDSSTSLAFYDITLAYGIHASPGSASSLLLSPSDLRAWKEVFYTSKVPANTVLTVDVLARDGTVLLPNVNSGDSLASINPSLFPSIQLRATFLTNDVSHTPELDMWGLRWVSGGILYFPIILR